MTKRGPKTTAGKDVVRLNAVRHGVLSTTPVIPDLEREEDWEAHLGGILESLAPEGLLEVKLTRRIAALLWRLERLERFEKDRIAASQEVVEDLWWVLEGKVVTESEVEREVDRPADMRDELQFLQECLSALKRLPELADDTPLSAEDACNILWAVSSPIGDIEIERFSFPGIPDDESPEDFTGWTADLVRRGIAAIAAIDDRDPEDLLASVTARERADVHLKQMRADRMANELDRMRRERLLPHPEELEKIVRYEAHLNRQLNQTLHELEALQARRQGGVTPLARVDVQGLQEN